MIDWKRISLHILFWSRYADDILILKFVALLMPITIVTSYLVNYFLILRKLLTGNYVQFAIYGLFIFVASLHLQGMLVMVAFASWANYSMNQIGPVASNVAYLGVSTYFVVFLSAIIFMFRRRNFQGEKNEKALMETAPILKEEDEAY